MRRALVGVFAGLFLTGMAGGAHATLVTFDLTPEGSWVTSPGGAVTTSLVTGDTGLGIANFALDTGETQVIDFFNISVTNRARGNYYLDAGLAMSEPILYEATGTGGVTVPSLFVSTENGFPNIKGMLVGGTLTWDSSTLPDVFVLADGTMISIDFEQGVRIPLSRSLTPRTTTIHAYITNLGPSQTAAATPATHGVPEPGMLVLLGLGFLGVGVATRRKRV